VGILSGEFQLLTNNYNIKDFDCGSITINEYLWNFALRFQESRIHRTWVLVNKEKIIGYFTLSVHHLKHKFSEIKFQTRWGTYPHYTPCLFIDMLGVDLKYSSKKKNYGTRFIEEIIKIADEIDEYAAIRLILLEALPNSLGFYYKNGFSILYEKKNIEEIIKFKKIFGIDFNIDKNRKIISTAEENYKRIRTLKIENKIMPITMFLDLL